MPVHRRRPLRLAVALCAAVLSAAAAAQTASAPKNDAAKKDVPKGATPKADPKKPAPQKPAAAAPAGPAAYAQRYAQVCATCHGANGRSDTEGVPVLAGQHSFYVVTQLFLYREGRRSNEAMTAVAKTLTDDDLRGFSDYIGTLPPVAGPAPSPPPDAARMTRAKALAAQHKCSFCHGDDLSGGQQVPRIGGQKEDYLRMTLTGYKTHTRPGYTRAMAEAVSQVPQADLDELAWYAARVPPGGTAPR